LDLPRLKDDVAVRQDDGRAAAAQVGDHVERAGIEPIGKRIVQQEERDAKELRVARPFDAISLQRAEVVGVAEPAAKLFEQIPVAPLAVLAKGVALMAAQILGDRVVVEERVVDVEQEHEVVPIRVLRGGAFGHQSSTSIESSVDTMLTTRAPKKAAQKPRTWKPSASAPESALVSHSMRPLTTSEQSPSVRMIGGKVRS